MLEKNEKKMYFDAHFHYFDVKNQFADDFPVNWMGCSSFLSIFEWEKSMENLKLLLAAKNPIENQKDTSNEKLNCKQNVQLLDQMIFSYGVHPLSFFPEKKNNNDNETDVLDKIKEQNKISLDFLESLLKKKMHQSESGKPKIAAVGECGFDFYLKDSVKTKECQVELFMNQVELAQKYSMPLIIHCRKGNELLFSLTKELEKLPAVLFHSFMGTKNEALSFCNRGVNAFFSFGKQCMNNNKKVIECIKELPLDKLLLETDAPFQKLKNEEKTFVSQITTVYEEAYKLRKSVDSKLELLDFHRVLENNFRNMYLI